VVFYFDFDFFVVVEEVCD